jgi:predicted acyl esterase
MRLQQLFLVLVNLCFLLSVAKFDFEIRQTWVTMKDGTNLSLTLAEPKPIVPGMKFPILLESLPYRKDDAFLLQHYDDYQYFASKGMIVAEVDLRGTGTSFGKRIPYEYSDIELQDIYQTIDFLCEQYEASNGNIGMYGISWSANNALLMTLKKYTHKCLKSVYVHHAADDLYLNDVHYLNGVKHQDEYILSIDHLNAMPRYPDFHIDEEYVNHRLSEKPWSAFYLNHSLYSDFWKRHSVLYQSDAMNPEISYHFTAGLYDGYRDYAMHMYSKLKPRVKCVQVVVGPFTHSYPDSSNPGPGYNGREHMFQWFDQQLNSIHRGFCTHEKDDVVFYIRNTSLSADEVVNRANHGFGVEGNYTFVDLQSQDFVWTTFAFSKQHSLTVKSKVKLDGFQFPREHSANGRTLKFTTDNFDSLTYKSWIGLEGHTWWGDLLGNQDNFDKQTLFYDSNALESDITTTGFPSICMTVSSSARLTHWIVRLLDVHPNGTSSLVSGALRNGAHAFGSVERPLEMEIDELFNFCFNLRFTTWTFHPGHKIRVSISNAYFRVIWPSTLFASTRLFLDPELTNFTLPVIGSYLSKTPQFTTVAPIAPTVKLPDGTFPYSGGGYPLSLCSKITDESTAVYWYSEYATYVAKLNVFIGTQISWKFIASHTSASRVSWLGHARSFLLWNISGDEQLVSIPAKPTGERVSLAYRLSDLPFRIDAVSNCKNKFGPSLLIPKVDLSPVTRYLQLTTNLSISSNETAFNFALERSLLENDQMKGFFEFLEIFPRSFQ